MNKNQPKDLDHNQIMTHIICHNDFIDFDIMGDAPPNSLMDSTTSSKGENNKKIKSWVRSLAPNTLGVKKHTLKLQHGD